MKACPRFGACTYCKFARQLKVGGSFQDRVYHCSKYGITRGYDIRWGNRPTAVRPATPDCLTTKRRIERP